MAVLPSCSEYTVTYCGEVTYREEVHDDSATDVGGCAQGCGAIEYRGGIYDREEVLEIFEEAETFTGVGSTVRNCRVDRVIGCHIHSGGNFGTIYEIYHGNI